MPRQPAKKEEYVCCRCNKRFNSLSYFYKTYSKLYTNTEHLPVCKDCFVELFYLYADKYKDEKKAMQRICMAFDLYYADYAFDGCCQDGKIAIGNYMRLLNIVQCRDKTFDTTIEEGYDPKKELIKRQPEKQAKAETKQAKAETKQEKEDTPAPEEPSISRSDLKRWGNGFEPEEYEYLNSHYKCLKEANPNCDSNQEIFIIDLCVTKMQQTQAVRAKDIDAYSKLTELYRKLFQQAGLKTVKESTTSAEDCWSSWTSIISRQAPEEYYKDKQLYKDMDGLDDYFKRNVGRPVNNLEFGTTERDYEYFVGDEEDGE